jgi:pimeloyl-ACP methyl ester carboxylesterase
MKKFINHFGILAWVLMMFQANAQTSMDYNILIQDIEFRTGVTIDINVNVYVNENAVNWVDQGKVFAIEGMAHTANCWKPFAEELFLNGPQGLSINEFYAIDMPGRGGSGLPNGWNSLSNAAFKLGDMYFEDYLSVIEGVLGYLNNVHGVSPQTIMGHSLGGLEVILLQDKLLNEGTNLRKKYKIKDAILLAPAFPAPLPWAMLGQGMVNQLLQMTGDHPVQGLILNIPYYVWPWLFFTNTCCHFPPVTMGGPGVTPSMVHGAPDAATVLANGYNSVEAAPLLLHMAGIPLSMTPFAPTYHPDRPRPSVSAGIFAPKNGVQLTIFAEEFDKMMSPAEEESLYVYLTGDNLLKRFLVALGTETCHDTHIADPGALVSLLTNPSFFKTAGEEIGQTDDTPVIYPNPSNGVFTIESTGDATVVIADVSGRLIRILYIEEGSYTVDLSEFGSGFYFVTISSSCNRQTHRVLVN